MNSIPAASGSRHRVDEAHTVEHGTDGRFYSQARKVQPFAARRAVAFFRNSKAMRTRGI
jgi:hypothetical protein